MKKIFIFVISVLLIISALILTDIIVSKKDSAPVVTIGHAICDESGNRNGGKAGDQNGEEVFTRSWYSGWSVVIRAKQPEQAEKIAAAMEQACANDNIGYDQYERTTLYEQAKKQRWNIEEISVPCETDCSALVSVCVNAAGIELSKDCYTGNLQKSLMDTGQFELLSDISYTDNPELLQRGDILLKQGHTAIVLKVESEE